MKISENAQEQLEKLWIATVEDEAVPEMTGVSLQDSDELLRLGLVKAEDHRVVLTAAGKNEATSAIRRHRLAERLMVDVLATEEALIESRACSLEHALVDGIDESICTLLGHPQVCPHGKPIPPGKCCQQMRDTVSRLIVPLRELKQGQEGQIAYIQMKDPQHLHKLMAMGVLPGVPLKVLSHFPSFVFAAGNSQFAVDEAIAADIYVRLNVR